MGTITRSLANNLSNSMGKSAVSGRNLVINGDMNIAQRTQSAVTVNSGSLQYPVDRFAGRGTTSAGVFTVEQDSESPDNFQNSVKATVTTSSTPGSSDTYRFVHHIEGTYFRHTGFGTSAAKNLTLSFYVRSSLTGTFGGAFIGGYDRFWNFSYTINSANTWERKTVTITGDTVASGWTTGTGLSARISWSLGAGSGEVGSANSWGTATYEGVTGQTNLIETNAATWYITGVQLEIGDNATEFDHQPTSIQKLNCERYYQQLSRTTTGGNTVLTGTNSAVNNLGVVHLPVEMRAAPTISQTGTNITLYSPDGASNASASNPTLSAGSFGTKGGRFLWSRTGNIYAGFWVDLDNDDSYYNFTAEI